MQAHLRDRIVASTGIAVCAAFALAGTALCQKADQGRWSAVARGLGRQGHAEDGYYRVEFPRSDLKVSIGAHTLAPAFELTTYFAFVPRPDGGVLSMGEIVMRDDEVNAVMDEARRQGVEIPALHNHLVGESPRLLYAHIMMTGPAASVAEKLRAVVARTATPLGPASPEVEGDKAAWSAVSAVLGEPEETAPTTAEWEFVRRDAITEAGTAVKSSGVLETASEVVFQQLGGGRVATTGEVFLSADEITPVSRALEAGGIHVTAIHMHMVRETPRLYWLHWYAVGEPAALAKTIHAALALTRSKAAAKD